jgi:hypothetical protein
VKRLIIAFLIIGGVGGGEPQVMTASVTRGEIIDAVG